jgi:hypothetical protein
MASPLRRNALDMTAYKSYGIKLQPVGEGRVATCEEVECQLMARGFRTAVDESSSLGQMQADYIRRQSGRRFTEERQPDGLTAFTFPAGQPCFTEHRAPVESLERYYVRAGDARGNPTGQFKAHTRAEHWVEDFAENQDRLRSAIEKG